MGNEREDAVSMLIIAGIFFAGFAFAIVASTQKSLRPATILPDRSRDV
jgi:hypothetical protein